MLETNKNHSGTPQEKISETKEKGEVENSSLESKQNTAFLKENKSSSVASKVGKGRRGTEKSFGQYHLKNETLATRRVVKVTKGGRRFSFTSLVLVKDESKNAVAFAQCGGKEILTALRKSSREAQKKLISYFSSPPRTIPHDILVSYKSTKIFLKPTPPGSGIKAGGALNKLFKFLGIKDVSAKIIGSRRNKLNVIRTAFMALDKLTGKKYDY